MNSGKLSNVCRDNFKKKEKEKKKEEKKANNMSWMRKYSEIQI